MKIYLSAIVLLLACCGLFAQDSDTTYQLSTHILDISTGQPAQGVRVVLEESKDDGEQWSKVAEGVTTAGGRISDFLPITEALDTTVARVYRLTFYTKPYFAAGDVPNFFPYVVVVFTIEGDQHYHVPITLSPYGYTTYRGS